MPQRTVAITSTEPSYIAPIYCTVNENRVFWRFPTECRVEITHTRLSVIKLSFHVLPMSQMHQFVAYGVILYRSSVHIIIHDVYDSFSLMWRVVGKHNLVPEGAIYLILHPMPWWKSDKCTNWPSTDVRTVYTLKWLSNYESVKLCCYSDTQLWINCFNESELPARSRTNNSQISCRCVTFVPVCVLKCAFKWELLE